MNKFISPTRVDLSGGTLDCWPLSTFVPEAVTVNLAIDIHTGVELHFLAEPKIKIEISNLSKTKEYTDIEDLIGCNDDSIALVRETVKYFVPALSKMKQGFSLRTFSDSPVGGGLGGSSSLCISLLKSFFYNLKLSLPAEKMVELAHNIEARVLHTPTGTQDYVPALLGGLSVLHYKDTGLQIENLSFDAAKVSESMGLVYTGRPHHSGINNWQVIKKAVEKDFQTLRCLREISLISLQVADVVRTKSWVELPELLNKECDARIALSAVFTSPEIEELRNTAFDLGAQASKICGAGGGGCVLVWADPEVHAKLDAECVKRNYLHLKVRAVPSLENAQVEKRL